jgi:hypothetical protein
MSTYEGPPPAAPPPEPPGQPKQPSGFSGLFQDPSTLAATGLLLAVLCAVAAGVFKFLGDMGGGFSFRYYLLELTGTADVGDVALLGIAVALLLLTPDPPGGIERPLLLRVDAVLAGVIALYGVIRSLVLLAEEGVSVVGRFGLFIQTIGVALAAATIAFYAAKESFLKQRGEI